MSSGSHSTTLRSICYINCSYVYLFIVGIGAKTKTQNNYYVPKDRQAQLHRSRTDEIKLHFLTLSFGLYIPALPSFRTTVLFYSPVKRYIYGPTSFGRRRHLLRLLQAQSELLIPFRQTLLFRYYCDGIQIHRSSNQPKSGMR